MITFNQRPRNVSLRIENAFIFLQYTYKELTKELFKDIDMSKFDTLTEVYVSCLIKCVEILNKRGLYKEYIRIENQELFSPKGSINISESLRRQSNIRSKLVCSYDELSSNIQHNQIIKTVLQDMTFNKDIKKEQIIQLKKCLTYFNGIDTLDLSKIDFRKIKYNNSNLRYKTIMDICKDMYFKSTINKYLKGADEFTFEDNLFLAFRKHLFNYYKSVYSSEYTVDFMLVPINEETSNKFELIYSKTKRLIIIKSKDKALIIDCYKYEGYTDIVKQDKQEKELRDIVKEYNSQTRLDTSGAIIYVNCSESYNTNKTEVSSINNILLANTTIDLNIKYNYIEYKLKKLKTVLLEDEQNERDSTTI